MFYLSNVPIFKLFSLLKLSNFQTVEIPVERFEVQIVGAKTFSKRSKLWFVVDKVDASSISVYFEHNKADKLCEKVRTVIMEGCTVMSVISLLTCNNTTSTFAIVGSCRDPRDQDRERREGRERMGPVLRAEEGSRRARRVRSILIIVSVIPGRSRRVNDFCISLDRSFRFVVR